MKASFILNGGVVGAIDQPDSNSSHYAQELDCRNRRIEELKGALAGEEAYSDMLYRELVTVRRFVGSLPGEMAQAHIDRQRGIDIRRCAVIAGRSLR